MDFDGIAFWKHFLDCRIQNWKNHGRALIAYDNSRLQVARLVKGYLESNDINMWIPLPYSSDKQSCDDFNYSVPLNCRLSGGI